MLQFIFELHCCSFFCIKNFLIVSGLQAPKNKLSKYIGSILENGPLNGVMDRLRKQLREFQRLYKIDDIKAAVKELELDGFELDEADNIAATFKKLCDHLEVTLYDLVPELRGEIYRTSWASRGAE